MNMHHRHYYACRILVQILYFFYNWVKRVFILFSAILKSHQNHNDLPDEASSSKENINIVVRNINRRLNSIIAVVQEIATLEDIKILKKDGYKFDLTLSKLSKESSFQKTLNEYVAPQPDGNLSNQVKDFLENFYSVWYRCVYENIQMGVIIRGAYMMSVVDSDL